MATTPPREPGPPRQWLVSCSPSRTLLARRADAGQTLLVKIYESGSPADAAREYDLGRRLAGPGIAEHLEVGTDPGSGRPCLLQRLVPGRSLDRLLADQGALEAPRAARIALGLARILERLADCRDARAPAGFVHGDLKPGNLLVDESPGPEPEVTLVDLEHAIEAPAAPPPPVPGFTGGTHGFAPPEAYEGAWPTPAFDGFGFGAVLHAMLSGAPPFGGPGADEAAIRRAVCSGSRRRWLLDGVPGRLRDLVEDCLAPEPGRRPAPATLVETLESWLASAGRPEDRDAEAARQLALQGRPLQALAGPPPELLADASWRARLARRARLLDRVGPPAGPDADLGVDALPAALATALPRLDAFLLRFPLHPAGRAARQRALEAAARLAVELPEQVQGLARATRFAEAERLCELAARALGRAGRLPRPAGAHPTRPSPAERDPLRVIVGLQRRVAAEREGYDRLAGRIRLAEAHGDLAEAEEALEELARLYGGASPVVAAAKDRLNRFDFYLARIGQQVALIDEFEPLLGELGLDTDLAPLARLRRGEANRSPARPRALLRALDDLVAEFPAIEPRIAPARAALDAALRSATARGFQLVDEAERMLGTPPIPIRPLTGLLTRLDRMLQIDALVDLPQGSRAALQDRIEGLRVRVEQARAERDRITRGAQEAMDRGHLTTAIYDMSRAVDRFDSEGSDGAGLAEQFEEARRRKREIEAALARNHALAARYGDLAADPASLPAERLSILHEREHLLSMLCANLGPERAAVYGEDLRAVQLDVLREHASDGARRLATARDPHERLAVAQRTFDALQQSAPDAGFGQQEAGQARALLREWLEIAEAAQRAARELPPPVRGSRDAQRRRRRAPRLLVAAVALAVAAVGVQAWLRDENRDPATALREALGDEVPLETTAAAPRFDATRAVARLRDFAVELRGTVPEVAAPARRTADAVDAVDRGAETFPAVEEAARSFGQASLDVADERLRAVLASFASRALRAGFVTAALRGPTPELQRQLAEDGVLRRALSAEDADALAAWLDR